MALSTDQFRDHSIASGLLTVEDVSSILSSLPAEKQPQDGEQLARELVRQKKLTKFQAEQIYLGKGKSLVLGNYTILDKLGQGGMGMVLKAEHKRLKRLVALKVLSPAALKTPDALKRFHREVEAAAKLRHTNVVATDDADEAKGTHFLVMEYVEGSDLSALVKKKGPLSVDQALQCILQAARGLEYAHKQGVVHRDIKPANLLLDTSGTVKILDMGLARIEGDSAGRAELTSTGAVMGTVDYMAPEQALSTKTADARSDIYSLGISLWYLLTGKCAYDGDTLMAKLLAHRDAPIPSLTAVRSEVSPSIDAAFQKMVAKQAKDRYQSMTDVIRDLEACQNGSASTSSLAAPSVPEDTNLMSFLTNLGGHSTSVTTTRQAQPTATRQGQPTATYVVADAAAEATMLTGDMAQATDPQTMTSVRSKGNQKKRTASKSSASPPWWQDRRIQIVGGAAAMLLLLAVIFLFSTPNGTLRVEILDPEVEMKVKGTELTFEGSNLDPVSLKAGEKKLQVTRGDLSFETEAFTLKKGTETRVKVELLGDNLVVNGGGKVIAEQPIKRKGITTSTTGSDSVASTSPAPNILTSPPAKPLLPKAVGDLPPGFVPLFNGKDLTGWKGEVGDPKKRAQMTPAELASAQAKADERMRAHWRAENGVLTFDGKGDNLCTAHDYADFELYLEWNITAGGDSGVYLRGAPQVQIWDSAVKQYGNNMGSGGLYNNKKHTARPLLNADKPIGEWNAMLIRMVGEKVTISLNGQLVVDEVVFENYFAPDQPIYPSGPIELQKFGSPLQFRNVLIRELKAGANIGRSQGTPPPAIAPFDSAQAKKHQEAWAKHLGTTVEMTNSVGMNMVLIPPGEFRMGEGLNQVDVKLTQALRLGKYEVTQDEYRAVMKSNPSHFSATGGGKDAVAGLNTDNLPVEMVSWDEATEFCRVLTTVERRDGQLPDGWEYRLPTDAQWEYACRAGTLSVYVFGDESQQLVDYAWYLVNSGMRAHDVGQKRPNAWGLHDLNGNVWEWCRDWHAESHTGGSNPEVTLESSFRVYRGGSYENAAQECRSAVRWRQSPELRNPALGFRVALVETRVNNALAKPPVQPVGQTPPPAKAPFAAQQARAHQEAWAKYLGVPVEYTNSIGMKFRLIPPGEFHMGGTPEEIEAAMNWANENKLVWAKPGILSEGPRHLVKLTMPFYLGATEVTQEQYERVMGMNPSFFAKTGQAPNLVEFVAGLNTSAHPVEGVNWHDTAEFCDKLSKREQLSPSNFQSRITAERQEGTGYRLPTEAEWEFACRAGTTTRLWNGDDDQFRIAWCDVNSGARTNPVGTLSANPFGLFDVHGNVWEWVQDGWTPIFYKQFAENAAVDPFNPGTPQARVVRGGDCFGSAIGNGASRRQADDATRRSQFYGFRAALSVDAVRQTLKNKPSNSTTTSSANPPQPAKAPFDAQQARTHQEAWAKHLRVPVEYTNSIGMKFRLIPPGEFTMGSSAAEIDAALKDVPADPNIQWTRKLIQSESPRHKAILSQPIYLGVYEVTQAEYEKVTGTNPSHFGPQGTGKEVVAGMDTPNFPVDNVSWNDAAECCAKLSLQEGYKPFYMRDGENVEPLDGTGYQLPTEAEWEFACRAGTTTKFWSGDRSEDLAKAGWFLDNAGGRTHRVGELKANSFGLYDVHGNPWEWIRDGWRSSDHGYGAYDEKTAINPYRPFAGCSDRMLRGGFWFHPASGCGSSSRHAFIPSARSPNTGFRMSLTVEAVKTTLATGESPQSDTALKFDGKQSHVQTPLVHGSDTPLTIEFTLLPGPRQNAVISDSEGKGMGIDILNNSISFLAFRRANDKQDYVRITAPRPLVAERAYRMATIYDNGKLRLFVDGKLEASADLKGEYLPSNLPFYLGASPEGEGIDYPYTGTLDEVRFSKIARYKTDYTPVARLTTDADTLALYHFDEGVGDVLTDSSGNNRHGKIIGAEWVNVVGSTIGAKSISGIVPPQPVASSGKLFMHDPAFPQWVKDVQAMPAEKQVEAVSKKLVELNPGFDGKLTKIDGRGPSTIGNASVNELKLLSAGVTDISPVRALSNLRLLDCRGEAVIGAKRNVLADLSPLEGMALGTLMIGHSEVADLSPIKNAQLAYLDCSYTKVSDLSPIKGMPLKTLSISNTQINDLSPIREMSLTNVICLDTQVADLSPLQNMKTLTSINVKRTKVTTASVAALQKALPNCKIVWDDPAKAIPPQPATTSKIFMHDPAFPQWMKDVQAMPAEQQLEAVSKKLVELNPGFQGRLYNYALTGPPIIQDGMVTSLGLIAEKVADISPVRAFSGLKNLECGSGSEREGKLADLSPLRGLQLSVFACNTTRVADLSPLSEMKLTNLHCSSTHVSDLSPVSTLGLQVLQINGTRVSKLPPLAGSSLHSLICDQTPIVDFSPVLDCKRLVLARLRGTNVTPTFIAALQKALPNCKIEWDDPAKAKTP